MASAPDDWVIGAMLRRQARERPDAVYLELTTGGRITYGQMDEDVDRVATGLGGIGVGFGDRVLVMMRNSAAYLQCWLALMRLGAVIVPVNTAFRGDFLDYVVNDSGGTTLVADAEFLPVVEASAPRLPGLSSVVVVGSDAAPRTDGPAAVPIRFEELLRAPARDPGVVVTPRDAASILYTSGTTGRSKGALLPHGHQRLNPHVYIDRLGLTSEDAIYCCLPLFHANGLLLQAYGAMILGARLILAPGFSASGWLGDIRRHGATATNLLGAMTEFVWRQPERPDDSETPLRIACVVPVPKFGEAFQRRFGMRMVELYGATEINCPFYMPRDEPLRPGSCGRIIDEWFEVRIADPETDEPVPDGEVGELLVRPKAAWTTMLGYVNQPDATVRTWRNLWFHTGDAFRRDPDGYYAFVDRLKDSLRRRGENISSFEVEQVLLAHPGVAEAAVVGVRSPTDEKEQEVMAFVVPQEGSLDPGELADFCAGRMPAFATPRYIEVRAALPKTQTQKVLKHLLREQGVGPNTWENPVISKPRQGPGERR
ncbi:ATP-dependent acyl-CoA ligase [Alsobacter metallidurans]|uniref:ATP-dependent acyl-CoA ligase n=1 Tax=Alsobacter metallidurans TaxID=340221 RepID=A0A917MIU6_9HYPH|nr:AMP-binding protein [Alsobacter metallidurans]GGH27910.1 ATP-dependent acyl-CoA ligase [Alsobacter metallidurans]